MPRIGMSGWRVELRGAQTLRVGWIFADDAAGAHLLLVQAGILTDEELEFLGGFPSIDRPCIAWSEPIVGHKAVAEYESALIGR